MQNASIEQLKKEPKKFKYYFLIFLILVALFIWSATVLAWKTPSSNGLEIAKSIFSGIFHPDFEFLLRLDNKGVFYLLLETLAIAFLGTVIGAVLAVPLAFFCATNLIPKPIAHFIRIIVMAIRTVPPFVYGLMFIRVTGPGSSAGIMTLGVISIGMLSKMFTETIEDLTTGILESMDAIGCTIFQKIRFGVISQLSPDFFSILLYRLDMNLRDASILGLVGAGGIGAPLIFAMNAYKWPQVGSIFIGLFFLIVIVEGISSSIRRYLLHY